MGTLDLLWELQKHDNNLKDMNLKLEEISNGEKAKMLALKLDQMESKLKDIEKRLENSQSKLNRNNLLLKDLDYRLNKTEKDLYEGKISDLKQLSYLDKEREIIKKNIDEKEMEIIEQLEEVENLKEEFLKVKKDFNVLKLEYDKLMEKYSITTENLKTKTKQELEEKEKIVSNVEESILHLYVKLRKEKGNALAEVVEDRCSGCNMLLPTIIIDKLKNMNTLVYCENCGRILYLKK
ncbi:putative nucleic acid-binding Zn-ribbon protein [Keratinibaculum paraultunense]|uniref:Putative nucleic acid-binding Zn-ribbon protein n=1 Tax=Keratinibaculum paraultunense TaxID=1278232 RepID=A0A4R3KYJ3_9FIRM|nr:C4-type zinc ribbon domain-containing protein [Keratinibaculum paraultunense]QQY80491.1 hypothetical protein JL105_04080 [Keratinibaculum paraultunense]TCS91210.1 putative nucleic acid-binding Zn-ribbon protein [Keratinibaculum paraultunense]